MYLAKGTKVLIEGIKFNYDELVRETSYFKLVQGVEDVYKHIKVTGFKFIDSKTIKLLTIKKEGDNVLIPMNSKISFISDGEFQEFILQVDSTMDMIEMAILEGYESFREESLCINGINYMFPNIKSGYMIIEGKIGDILNDEGKETYFSLKNVQNIMKLGIRKGDTLHLNKVSSFKIADVDYGDRLLALSVE